MKQTTINDIFKFAQFQGISAPSKAQNQKKPTQNPPWGRSDSITSVGVADLMVVKQHIKRYEATEIAHIENVMAKEERGRKHRFLERIEETVTLEREVTDTRERELETSERFELNKEASQTIQEDQKYGFDLSVSAKYGSTVEVRSGFEFGASESRQSAIKSATSYAKNVTDRSLQRIEQRVREERIRKLIRETEETNRHAFKNDTDEHIIGIYQFVDKIYEAQVFNYGKREMFDLFVPEPASFIWALEANPDEISTGTDIPSPPEPFDLGPSDISPSPDGDGTLYSDLVAKYAATGIQPPKPASVTVSASQQFPASEGGGPGQGAADDEGAPRFVDTLSIKIPSGYRPIEANLAALASSDSPKDIYVYYSFEKETGHWKGTESGPHETIRNGIRTVALSEFTEYASEGEAGLSVNILVWDSSQWAVSVHIKCELTNEEFQKWQIATYETIQSAYFDRLKEWENEVSKIKSETRARAQNQQQPVGLPPSKRKNTIVNELKKHCISILTGYWYQNPTVMNRKQDPPTFDLARTESYGSAVQFFEHAFEWHQVQYAFYPYYWASKDSWSRRFRRSDPDYEYQQFLQAGAARVMVPVRPGFEYAVNLYLEKGIIWEGRNKPENIEDPTYLSIVDQMKEQSGEELEEPVPVGSPWEIRVPTSLIRLKGRVSSESDFPQWTRIDGEVWEWTSETVEED